MHIVTVYKDDTKPCMHNNIISNDISSPAATSWILTLMCPAL